MSTKQTIDFSSREKLAKREIRIASARLKKRRETRQLRIRKDLYLRIRAAARDFGITISKMGDKAVLAYLGNKQSLPKAGKSSGN